MSVLEAGQEHPTMQIDDVRLGPAGCLDLCARADRCDAPRPNGDRLGPAPGGVHRVDASAREDEIGCFTRGHAATLSDSRPLVQAGTEPRHPFAQGLLSLEIEKEERCES